jgi:hypothetical protein
VARRAIISLLPALLAIVALVGCGAEDVASDAASQDIARAAESTAKAGGARVAIDALAKAPEGEVKITGNGFFDAQGNCDLEMEIAAAGKRSTMHQIFAGETLFMSSDAFGDLPGGKEWIKIDFGKVSDFIGPGDLPESNGTDPRETLRFLRAAGKVERAGTEEVRGVKTTRYNATVQMRRLPEQVDPSERAAARRSVERLIKLTGEDVFRTEVWVDDEDNLVRRTRQTFSVPGPKGQKAELTGTTEFFDFGAAGHVEVPADSEVVDYTKLAAREARKQQRD